MGGPKGTTEKGQGSPSLQTLMLSSLLLFLLLFLSSVYLSVGLSDFFVKRGDG